MVADTSDKCPSPRKSALQTLLNNYGLGERKKGLDASVPHSHCLYSCGV